jgi:predicted nucleic acid-binding protein
LRVYVVDASVAARFLLVEEFSDKAEWLLQKFHDGAVELKAPGLERDEVGTLSGRLSNRDSSTFTRPHRSSHSSSSSNWIALN